MTESAAGRLHCKEKEIGFYLGDPDSNSWIGSQRLTPDEVLVVKQMCLPSIQISFPNVDLD